MVHDLVLGRPAMISCGQRGPLRVLDFVLCMWFSEPATSHDFDNMKPTSCQYFAEKSGTMVQGVYEYENLHGSGLFFKFRTACDVNTCTKDRNGDERTVLEVVSISLEMIEE